MANKQNKEIRKYILNNVDKNPTTINRMAVAKYGISRGAIHNYLKTLVAEGFLEAKGNTKARSYKTKPISCVFFNIELSHGLSEDAIWRHRVLPFVKNVTQNVIDICQYCFTEILNNAIDHSVSEDCIVDYQQTHNKITIKISDNGVGIFEKIRKDFNLIDSRTALLELVKGKITSDKANHSGQGIFFSSRMVDEFNISSGNLSYSRERIKDDEWTTQIEEKSSEFSTSISMTIYTNTSRTTREVFNKYQEADLSFRKAHVPIKLGKYPSEQLVSRSQAKRVLARFENFTEVQLDFEGIDDIGQAFADEIFRVFKNSHPTTKITAINTSKQIKKMIDFIVAYDREQTKD